MAGKDGLRRRKASKQTGKDRESEQNVSRGANSCKRFLWLSFFVNSAVAGFLYYAYKTSPISSIVMDGIHDMRGLKWTQANNSDLQHGKKFLEELHGPESIVVDKDGNWYTGLNDGRIVKITNGDEDKATVIDITESIDFAKGSSRHGKRPLGLRLVNNNLYFADASQGLFVIDIKTLRWEKIVGYDDVNPPMLFPDDLVITGDEKTIYLTDVSTRWGYEDSAYCLIEGECSGRVFKVDIRTKHAETIYEGLCLANGIELDLAENNLILSENSGRRVIVVDLKSRTIIKTILMPGAPDNIRRSKNGGYWVPIPILHDLSFDLMLRYPFIRLIVTSLIDVNMMKKLFKVNPGVIVKLDEKFDPVSIHYDMDGKVSQLITEVAELENGDLLLGSFDAFGIAKIDGHTFKK